MSHDEPHIWPGEDEFLDEEDVAVLDRLRQAFGAADPMPADLPERIRFSLALRDLDVEVALLSATEVDELAMAVRGVEATRTVTFDSDSLTIMIRVDGDEDGTVRVDGWLAPAQPRTIELATASGALTALADERGRFAFARVPRGRAQLLVRAVPGSSDPGHSVVVAPALIL